jgi:hypothetical protein
MKKKDSLGLEQKNNFYIIIILYLEYLRLQWLKKKETLFILIIELKSN